MSFSVFDPCSIGGFVGTDPQLYHYVPVEGRQAAPHVRRTAREAFKPDKLVRSGRKA